MTEPTSPLHIRDYRFFWLARLVAISATVSMVVLIGYQAYDIARDDYGMARSEAAFILGLLGVAQFIPLMLFTPVAGWAADRFDRRRVAAGANLVDSGIAALLAFLTWNNAVDLPIIFALAAAHGAARIFLGPAQSAIAPNIVPPKLLPKAIALGSIAFTIGTVCGPAAGGFLYDYDPALPYIVSSVLILCSAILMSLIRPIRARQSEKRVHPIRQMIDGGKFVWNDRFLLGCISLDLFAVLLGGATAMLPVFARDILEVGPQGLGLMRGAPAAGAGLVALLFSFRPIETNVGTKMLWGVAFFGIATVGFGLSRDLMLSLFFLALLGAADMVSVFIRNSLVQLNTPDEMRGRVSSISGLAISASNELGEMQSGLAAALIGAVGAVVLGGAGAIFVTALWAWIFPELRRAKTFAPQYRHEGKEPRHEG
ncbi:MFS transporter [Altericroceibacterium spongiae]|uniref:Multidrug efflux pump Tap n=1 Tax=Altericroceibacterium spongiae TaxID=2320269 RepID=A0A420ES56_9SPHN|nr:MFS transporter [Altericroceibacterium spongiae]RKF23501.1 MFS transporter [Altericroceibacterium spongiae]